MFFTIFKLFKWYQIAQSVSYFTFSVTRKPGYQSFAYSLIADKLPQINGNKKNIDSKVTKMTLFCQCYEASFYKFQSIKLGFDVA